MELHCELRVTARARASGELCSPLACGLSLEELRDVLGRVFLQVVPGAGAGALEVDVVPQGGAPRCEAFLLRRSLASADDEAEGLSRLQVLRDQVLSGDFDLAVAQALGADATCSLHADRSEFAEQFERSVLQLDRLTPHQQLKLDECSTQDACCGVHVRAPAGAGKTFLALQRVLDILREDSSEDKKVLFVARNAALSYFAASWIGKRVQGRSCRLRVLSKLHLLHAPFEQGMQSVLARGGRVFLQPLAVTEKRTQYALLVVDEAHHLYASSEARAAIEAQVTQGLTQRLLLSDISQSLGREVLYPEGLRDVVLSEVVRCSKRIVAGAMAFQLGGEEKLLTKCHHDATGPPLRSFLFDLTTEPHAEASFEAYAEHTLRAVEHVVSVFSGLSLHNRLAFVVPSSDFAARLRPHLSRKLADRFPQINEVYELAQRCFHLIDATEASACLGDACLAEDRGSSADEALEDEAPRGGEWLVFDSIHQVDGLERLIVIGIGLDSVIGGEAVSEGGSALEARSALYRALTRAHLMVLVVNEFLRGGWLEFLGSVRLREDEAFDSKAELGRSEIKAVEGVVKAELSTAVAAAAEALGLRLEDQALTALAADVAAMRELGQASTEASVERVLQSWTFEIGQVLAALETAAESAGMPASVDSGTLESLAAPLTLALHRGDVVNLAAAALEAVRAHHSKRREALAGRALRAALGLLAPPTWMDSLPPFSPEAESALQPRVLDWVSDRGLSWEMAAQEAAQEWMQVEEQISEQVLRVYEKLHLGHWVSSERNDSEAHLQLRSALGAAVWKGAALGDAARHVVLEWRHKRQEAEVCSALEAAWSRATSQELVCCSGARVRVQGVVTQPELNDKEGSVEFFVASTGRWSVRLDCEQPRQRSRGLKPSRLQVLSMEETQQQLLAAIFPLATALPQLGLAVQKAVQNDAAARGAAAIEEHEEAHDAEEDGEEVHDAEAAEEAAAADASRSLGPRAAGAVAKYRELAAQVSSAMDNLACSRALHIREEDLGTLCTAVIGQVWDAASKEEDSFWASLEAAIVSAVDEFEQRQRFQQAESAEIASAVEAAAHAQRLLLTDAAASALHQRVAAAMRRGESLEQAVSAAVREWHKQMVRKQVQQTVWDSSGNSTRRVTGMVRFMPFKHTDSGRFDYELLVCVFSALPFGSLGELARVCKRWRSVAADPAWKPELVAYAWGPAALTGLSSACPRPKLLELSLTLCIVHIACADAATFVVTEAGDVWFWGRSWLGEEEPVCSTPTRISELRDVVSVTTTPSGYFHGRARVADGGGGYSCAAITHDGGLYTWGANVAGQLLQSHGLDVWVPRPKRISVPFRNAEGTDFVWRPASERVLHVACGLRYLAICIQRPGGSSAVLSCGSFCSSAPHRLHEWPELEGVALRQLTGGSFHCCALSTRGEVYTFGDEKGQDQANGNLLGFSRQLGQYRVPIHFAGAVAPRRLETEGLGPVAEVSCSTYSTLAITVDGRAFTWGDADGDALGHTHRPCNEPHWLRSIRFQRVAHGSLAYTNGAVASDEGRVFVWGGNMWEGGIAEGRASRGPTEIKWSGVPSCYRCTSVALGHKHGFLVFRKQP